MIYLSLRLVCAPLCCGGYAAVKLFLNGKPQLNKPMRHVKFCLCIWKE